MKKTKQVANVVPMRSESEDSPLTTVMTQPTLATKYSVRILVAPVDGYGAQIDITDNRLEAGSFASPSELAWALVEALEATTKLFAQHHGLPSEERVEPQEH